MLISVEDEFRASGMEGNVAQLSPRKEEDVVRLALGAVEIRGPCELYDSSISALEIGIAAVGIPLVFESSLGFLLVF